MKYFAPTRISENIHKTPEGYLLCVGVPIGRTGEMVYGRDETPLEVGPDGRVLISREPEELFRPETIASFQGKAFTLEHPEDFVGPDNWSELTHGILQNVRRGKGDQGEDLIADLLVTSEEAIASIENGLREVSCGYEAEYIQTGEGKGKQVNIIGNHLALVKQGRAGPSYAINDHIAKEEKGANEMKKKIGEQIKALFAKAQDDAMKVIDEDMSEKKEEKKEESKDQMGQGYDELIKMVKDLGEKVSSLMPKSKDESSEEKKEQPKDEAPGEKKEEKKDESKDDGEVAPSLESRLEKLEAMVAAMMEGESEESEEMGDEEESEEMGEESEDEKEDKEESSVLTGDTASRAEILSPGIKLTKDVKTLALKKAYGTQEGKRVIDALTGGKALTLDSAEKVDHLFVAASEILKASRSSEFSQTKRARGFTSDADSPNVMTPERLNEIHAAKYQA